MTVYDRRRGARGRPRSAYYRGGRHNRAVRTRTHERHINKGTVLTVFGALLIAAVLGFILVWFFSSYFNVKTIMLSADGKYSADEVIAVSGLQKGVKLYSVKTAPAEEKILSAFPEIKSVRVKKELPATLVIDVIYETPKYYINITGENFTLSETLRVLSRGGKDADMRVLGLVRLVLPGVKRAVTGERLEFFDGEGGYAEEFLKTFSESYFADKTDRITVRSKFDIDLVKIGNYRIEMGDVDDAELKFRMAKKVLEDGSYDGRDGVIIDVSDSSEAGVRVVKTLKIE